MTNQTKGIITGQMAFLSLIEQYDITFQEAENVIKTMKKDGLFYKIRGTHYIRQRDYESYIHEHVCPKYRKIEG